MAFENLIDPTGGLDLDADTTLTRRPATLRGTTLGLLENTKPNAAVLLHELGEILTRRYGISEVLSYSKTYFGTPATASQVELIARECDLVVTGVGD